MSDYTRIHHARASYKLVEGFGAFEKSCGDERKVICGKQTLRSIVGVTILSIGIAASCGCSKPDGINTPLDIAGVEFRCVSAKRIDDPNLREFGWAHFQRETRDGEVVTDIDRAGEFVDIILIEVSDTAWDSYYYGGFDRLSLSIGSSHETPVQYLREESKGTFTLVFMVADNKKGPVTLHVDEENSIVLDSLLAE